MVFYISDQGARVSTPLGELLRPRGVTQTSQTAASAPVRGHEDRPGEVEGQATGAYRRAQSQARQPAVFAEQIMSRPPLTLPAHAQVSEAWALFRQRRIHHLPLVDGEAALVGIVSDRDLLRAGLNDTQIAVRPLELVMTRRVVSAGPDAEIRALAEVMVAQRIGAVPIVDPDHAVLGLVTRSDILRALVHQAPLEMWV